MPNEARMTLSRLTRAQERLQQAQQEVDAATERLTAIHAAACEKLGREVPTDALLLDVLALIDVEDGDTWVWNGMRNNKGLAVVRPRRSSEVSLVRYLAIEFGLITEDDYGVLYPMNGPDDVNPWHRELRAAEKPVGNPNRFGFSLPDRGVES